MTTPKRRATPQIGATPSASAAAVWRAIWPAARRLVGAFRRQPISMLAKQAAYSILYAIPSALLVLVSLAAYVDKRLNASLSQLLLDFIDERAPTELQPLLHSLVEQAIVESSRREATYKALVSLGVAVWSGAGGVGALIDACNLVYEVRDTRGWFFRTLLKLGLMIVGGLFVVVAFVLFVFGQRLGEWIAEGAEPGSALHEFFSSGRNWTIASGALAAALVFVSLLLLYMLAPDVEQSLRWVVPGTVLGTLGIWTLFAGLDVFLDFADPGSAYGAAGSSLILLWALYLMSTVVVGGAVVNAVVTRRFDPKRRRYLRAHPENRTANEAKHAD